MASTPELVVSRLKVNPKYIELFHKAFGNNQITFDNVANAIEIYENTLIKRATFGGENIQRFPLRDNNGLFVHIFRYSKHKARTLESIKFNFSPIYKPFPFENIGGFMGKDATREFPSTNLAKYYKNCTIFS